MAAGVHAALETASAMQPRPLALTPAARGTTTATFDLPRQGVALILL